MYDLTVETVHTFAVGTGGWVVHNRNPCFGTLYAPNHDPLPLRSGYSGPSEAVRGQGLPGFNGNQLGHVEGHTAAYMRTNQIQEAALEIDKVPCTLGPGGGCAGLLPRMLPPGSTLTVVGPGGYRNVFTGLPDPTR